MSVHIDRKKSIKNKSEYEVYQDELNQYKNRSKVIPKSQQWNLIQSRLISPLSQHKDKKYEAAKTPKHHGDSSEKYESTSVNEKKKKDTGSYSEKIRQKLNQIKASEKTNQQLQQEIKSMREMLIFLNNIVNNKLSKYQLYQFVPKGMSPVNHPQKQSQLLQSQIDVNSRIIQSFEKEIREIKERDQELERKDYLIQLEQAANQVLAAIKEKRKQKHNGKVTVEKLDSRLLEMKEAVVQDEFKMVKVVKHNTLYFYKKIKENEKIIEELDRSYKQLLEKDRRLTEELNKYTALAQQQNMPVTTNPAYLQIMRTQNELSKIVNQNRKKVQVVKKSKEAECLKISLDIERIKNQLMGIQAKFEEYQIRDNEVTNFTQNAMEKSKVSEKILNKISNRYAQGIAHKLIRNTVKEVAQHDDQELNNKMPAINQKRKSLNASLDYKSQYRTLSVKPNIKTSRFKEQYERNSRTIQFESVEGRDFRVKPSLHLKKKSEQFKSPKLTPKSNQISQPTHTENTK